MSRKKYESHPMTLAWNLWRESIIAAGGQATLSELHAFQAGWQAAVNQFATFGVAQHKTGE